MFLSRKKRNALNDALIGQSLSYERWLLFVSHKQGFVCLILFITIALMCFIFPFFSPYTHDDVNFDAIEIPPQIENAHFFGTDSNGRDLFVRTLYGGQISLIVGFVASFVSTLIGILYGSIAGFFGGRVDNMMMRFVDVMYALPFMFFVILLTVFFGRNIVLIFVAIGCVEWLDMARVVRGQTLVIKNQEYIASARTLGVKRFVILLRHVIPNLWAPVIVMITLIVPRIIMTESFLSFLGLGVQEPMTSWGTLIERGAKMTDVAPWLLIFPGAFLILTLLSLNFIGNTLQKVINTSQTS